MVDSVIDTKQSENPVKSVRTPVREYCPNPGIL